MLRPLRHLIVALTLGFVGLQGSHALALYSEACFVRFSVDYPTTRRHDSRTAQSRVFAVSCNYLTGEELNHRFREEGFSRDRVYVVILWPRSRPSFIRISQPLPFCGDVTESGCADRISGRLRGRDDWYDGRGRLLRRTWDICQPGFIGRDCYEALGARSY